MGPDEQAPELLARLFALGADLLLARLGDVWEGRAPPEACGRQDEAAATHAPKLAREEAQLDFSQPAAAVHNKVRAFAAGPLFPSQPGTSAPFQLRPEEGGPGEPLELKVLRTRVVGELAWQGGGDPREVAATREGLHVRCADGSVLELVEVQPPGKRPMAPRDFVNGLRGKTLHWVPLGAPVAA